MNQEKQPVKELNKEDLTPLIELINKYYFVLTKRSTNTNIEGIVRK